MSKIAKEYIESTDKKINIINENGNKKLIFDISINLGSNYKGELPIIEKHYKDRGFSIEIEVCKSKLIDIIIIW